MSKVRPFARGLVLAVTAALLSAAPAAAQEPVRVLVYHETSGEPHESVDAAVEAIEEIGGDDFAVDATDDSGEFTAANLARYRAVVFLSTNGDVLTAAEEEAFREFVADGGGFAGIHDAARVEPASDWFTGLIGSRPAQSPEGVQEAVVEVPDRVHPATEDLPLAWTRNDEWLNWDPNPVGKVHTVAQVEERTTTRARAATAGSTRSPGAVTTTAAGPSTPAWATPPRATARDAFRSAPARRAPVDHRASCAATARRRSPPTTRSSGSPRRPPGNGAASSTRSASRTA